MIISFSDEHPLNALHSIDLTDEGIAISSIFLNNWNDFSPIEVTELGIAIIFSSYIFTNSSFSNSFFPDNKEYITNNLFCITACWSESWLKIKLFEIPKEKSNKT